MLGKTFAFLSTVAAYASPAVAFANGGPTRRTDNKSPIIVNSLRDIASEMDSWMDGRMDGRMRMEMDMNMDMDMDMERRPRPRNMGPGPGGAPMGEPYFDPRWGGPQPQSRPPYDRQFDYDPSNDHFDPVWTQSTPSVRDDRRNEGFGNRQMHGPFEDEPYGFEPWGEGSFYPDRHFGYGP